MPEPNHGVIDVRSHRSVPQSIDRLQSLAATAGLLIFARIDFSGDAQRAGIPRGQTRFSARAARQHCRSARSGREGRGGLVRARARRPTAGGYGQTSAPRSSLHSCHGLL